MYPKGYLFKKKKLYLSPSITVTCLLEELSMRGYGRFQLKSVELQLHLNHLLSLV